MTIGGLDPSSGNTPIPATAGTDIRQKLEEANQTVLDMKAKRTTDENELQTLELSETDGAAKTENVANDAVAEITNATNDMEERYNTQIKECFEQIKKIQEQIQSIEDQKRALMGQLVNNDDITQFMSTYQQLNNQKNSLYNNINTILINISSLEDALANSKIQAQNSIEQINSLSSQITDLSNIQTSTGQGFTIDSNTNLADAIVALGNSFVGVINNDAQGNKEFSPNGVSQAWCADFVTAIVKRSCAATGTPVPAGFGSSAVSGIASWGKNNGRYIQTAGKGNKAEIIANTVKPGDIMVQKENGASHVGIVTKVYPDGSFDTVEGNTSDAVKNRHYSANSDKLSGFVRVT